MNTRIFQSKIACWSQYNRTQIAKDSQNGLTFIDTLNNLKNLILINCHYCHYNWVFLQQVGYIISHSDCNSIQIHLPNFPTMAIETNSRMKQHGIFLHGYIGFPLLEMETRNQCHMWNNFYLTYWCKKEGQIGLSLLKIEIKYQMLKNPSNLHIVGNYYQCLRIDVNGPKS